MNILPKVFISSPYSADEQNNVDKQILFANELIDLEINPFVPLLYHYIAITKARSYDIWLMLLIQWLSSCDVVLCTGKSNGTDNEVLEAKRLNIPVVYSIDELKELLNNNQVVQLKS